MAAAGDSTATEPDTMSQEVPLHAVQHVLVHAMDSSEACYKQLPLHMLSERLSTACNQLQTHTLHPQVPEPCGG